MGCCCTRQRKQELLKNKRKRLLLYYEREREMLEGGVKAYGIGSRNITRYETDLGNIRAAIKGLEAEVAALEADLCGKGARKAVAVVPRDW